MPYTRNHKPVTTYRGLVFFLTPAPEPPAGGGPAMPPEAALEGRRGGGPPVAGVDAERN